MKNKSPAFQFYPSDFLSDEKVMMMNYEERGIYITLLSVCWIEGSIPSDPEMLERLLRNGGAIKGLDFILKCFDPHLTLEGRLVHKRLDREREKQVEHSKQKSKSGKEGAKKRWDSKVTPYDLKAENGTAIFCHDSANGKKMGTHDSVNGKTMANDSSSSSSSFPSSSSKKDIKTPMAEFNNSTGEVVSDPDKFVSSLESEPPSSSEPKKPPGKVKKPVDPRVKQILNHYHTDFESVFQCKPMIEGGKDGKLIRGLLKNYPEDTVRQKLSEFLRTEDEFIASTGRTLGVFYKCFSKLMVGQTGPPKYTNGNNQTHKPALRL